MLTVFVFSALPGLSDLGLQTLQSQPLLSAQARAIHKSDGVVEVVQTTDVDARDSPPYFTGRTDADIVLLVGAQSCVHLTMSSLSYSLGMSEECFNSLHGLYLWHAGSRS